MRLRLEPEAEAELDDAFEYYEGKQAGLGHRFLDVVESRLDQIAVQPDVVSSPARRLARCHPSRLSLSIVYRIEQTTIRVLAVFHHARDPRHIQQRIDEISSD